MYPALYCAVYNEVVNDTHVAFILVHSILLYEEERDGGDANIRGHYKPGDRTKNITIKRWNLQYTDWYTHQAKTRTTQNTSNP